MYQSNNANISQCSSPIDLKIQTYIMINYCLQIFTTGNEDWMHVKLEEEKERSDRYDTRHKKYCTSKMRCRRRRSLCLGGKFIKLFTSFVSH